MEIEREKVAKHENVVGVEILKTHNTVLVLVTDVTGARTSYEVTAEGGHIGCHGLRVDKDDSGSGSWWQKALD